MNWDATIDAIEAATPALTAAFVARDLDLFNTLVRDITAPTRISIAIDDARTPAEAAPLWRLNEAGRSRFFFNSSVYRQYPGFIITRWLHFLPAILAGLRDASAPGSCFLNLGDEGHVEGLTFCDNRPGFTLVPDCIFLAARGYAATFRHFRTADVPWEQRKPVAFWRGTTTGVRTGDVFELPRVRLCQLGKALGDRADIGVSQFAQLKTDDEAAALTAAGILRDFVPPAAFNQYQLHIDIDGNSNSWPGLLLKLHSGSPVLKVASQDGFRQWYYDRLVPFVNFVPVSADLSDLHEMIALMFDRPAFARMIGEQGRALAAGMTMEAELDWARPVIAGALAGRHPRPETRQAPPAPIVVPPATTIADAAPAEETSIRLTGDFDGPLGRAIAAALRAALALDPVLPDWVLRLNGMSGRLLRRFVNALVGALDAPRYLETGVGAGATACAAMIGNRATLLCIDDWSESRSLRDSFIANSAAARSDAVDLTLIEADFRTIDYAALGSFNIYQFDGQPDRREQYDGMMLAQPALDADYVQIVDDWNWPQVRAGTQEAIAACGRRVVCAIEIRTTQDDSHPARAIQQYSAWHNGCWIAVLARD